MSKKDCKPSKKESPLSSGEVKEKIRNKCELLIVYCGEERAEESFLAFEKSVRSELNLFICLFFQLFFISLHERFDYSKFLPNELYYPGRDVPRTVKTLYGEVRYWRTYFMRKGGGEGFYPLDALIGVTLDGFSPWVMSLATKLATRMSFASSVLVFKSFCGWSPSSEAIQALTLGMGRYSLVYMLEVDPPANDGEVLIIEVDGKATPTATEKELKKRRGERDKTKHRCCCPRHRGKDRRKCRCKKSRRKKGDKSKNGRSITLVVMYTLKKGEDGDLHGPINKKVWGSYAPRKVMFEWARSQATKRGFPEQTDKRVHIVVDGEKCLKKGLTKLFPNATFALDICHLEEKIWELGRKFHKEGSDELKNWVEDKRELIYTGKAAQLLSDLKKLQLSLSVRAKRDKGKREATTKLINYMKGRLDMMEYKKLLDEDMVIASGIVEGAARHVVGERLDCSGMRWIPQRAEALLRLRCIELNGDWDHFFEWGYKRWMERMEQGEKVVIRQEKPDELPNVKSIKISDYLTVKEDGYLLDNAA